MSLKFNPPREEQKKLPRYASYAAGVMKTHSSIGHAKNSLNNRMWSWTGSRENGDRQRVTTYAALLENVNGQWYTLYDIPEGTTRENLPWMKEYYYDGYGTWSLVTDYHKSSKYYQDKFSSGQYRVMKRPASMTRDEYVEWRLAVAREQWEEDEVKNGSPAYRRHFQDKQTERLVSQ